MAPCRNNPSTRAGRSIRWLLRNDGHGFDLNQKLGTKQSRDLDCCARRRILDGDEAVAYLAILGQSGAIDHIHVELDDVGERSSRRFHGSSEVLEDLLRLRAEIAGTDQMAGGIERDLARDEHGCAALYSCQ